MKSEKFEELLCWQEARILTGLVFTNLDELNRVPILQKQVQESAMSIMGNIAESANQFGNEKIIHSLDLALASCRSMKNMLYVCEDLSYLSQENMEAIQDQLGKTTALTIGFVRYFRKDKSSKNTPQKEENSEPSVEKESTKATQKESTTKVSKTIKKAS